LERKAFYILDNHRHFYVIHSLMVNFFSYCYSASKKYQWRRTEEEQRYRISRSVAIITEKYKCEKI